jgi:hypothetical protein
LTAGATGASTAACTVTSATYSQTGGCTSVSVSLTTGTRVLVIVTGEITPASNEQGNLSFDVSGATTVAAADANAVIRSAGSSTGTGAVQASTVTYLTVTAGTNVFTLDQDRTAGTVTMSNRKISVVPLN